MAQLEPVSEITSVDDFYFSALFDEPPSEVFPISDSKYAEELHFQEALMSSTQTTPQTTTNPPETTSLASSSSSLQLSASSPAQTLVQILVPFAASNEEEYQLELGEASQMFCEICSERKSPSEKFPSGLDCAHSFCSDCIAKHVSAKLEESSAASESITCPGLDCRGVHVIANAGPERGALPREVVERWDEALCRALVMALPRLHCPFEDCSAVMVMVMDEAEAVEESECPECHRLFCARCLVGPWHAGVGCEEFGRLREDERGREDLMVMAMADENKWRRCPKCLFFVEKTEGCLHITCRCAFEFCYACGDTWTQTHGGCQ